MKQIQVVNKSTVTKDADVVTACAAITVQIARHVAPAWGKAPVPVNFTSTPDPSDPVITVADDPDQSGALGWHTEDSTVYGFVFVKPVLQYGGDMLYRVLSMASVLSHEVVETFGDPPCNVWAQASDGSMYAQELCDPVEEAAYICGPNKVAVSDFVLPAWFDPNAKPDSRFSWMRSVSAPFQIAHGGYAVLSQNGQVVQHYGDTFPEWRKGIKKGRTAWRELVLDAHPEVA